MKSLLVAALALLLSGPIRFGSPNRPIETLLVDPLQIDLTIWLQLAIVAFGAMTGLLAWLQRGLYAPPLPAPLRSGPFFAYFLYAALAAFSVLYSLQPLYTLYFGLRLLVAVGVVGLAAEYLGWKKVLEIFYFVHVLRWLCIAILYYVWPEVVGTYIKGVGYRLHAQPLNDYGLSAAISGFYFLLRFTEAPHSRKLLLGCYAVTLYFLYLSRTRSTILIAVVFFCAPFVSRHQSSNARLRLCW